MPNPQASGAAPQGKRRLSNPPKAGNQRTGVAVIVHLHGDRHPCLASAREGLHLEEKAVVCPGRRVFHNYTAEGVHRMPKSGRMKRRAKSVSMKRKLSKDVFDR